MAVAYLLDEHLRGPMWRAVRRHNSSSRWPIDVERVGDPETPPLGTLDPELLLWSEAARRIIVTLDKETMPQHLREHLAAGHHSPGVFVIRRGQSFHDVIELLACVAFASEEAEWQDQIVYIP